MKLSIGAIITLAQVVPAIVSNIQRAFGKEPGAVRKQAAKDAALDVVVAIEGVTGRDLLQNDKAQVLLDEMIELSVTQMKIGKRLLEIDEEIKALRVPQPAPAPAVEG
jgi:hypothetical protein